MRIHHIGIVVADIEAELVNYVQFFRVEFTHRERLETLGVDVAIALLPGGGEIELLSPIGEDTGIAKFLRERGQGMHHVAYTVANLSDALVICRERGIELIDDVPRRGAGNTQVAFLHPRSTGRVLIELVQSEQ